MVVQTKASDSCIRVMLKKSQSYSRFQRIRFNNRMKNLGILQRDKKILLLRLLFLYIFSDEMNTSRLNIDNSHVKLNAILENA